MGFEGKYIRADRARSSKGGISFVLNGKLDHTIHELVMRMLPIWYVMDSMHSNLAHACKCNHPCGVVRLSTSLTQYDAAIAFDILDCHLQICCQLRIACMTYLLPAVLMLCCCCSECVVVIKRFVETRSAYQWG